MSSSVTRDLLGAADDDDCLLSLSQQCIARTFSTLFVFSFCVRFVPSRSFNLLNLLPIVWFSLSPVTLLILKPLENIYVKKTRTRATTAAAIAVGSNKF